MKWKLPGSQGKADEQDFVATALHLEEGDQPQMGRYNLSALTKTSYRHFFLKSSKNGVIHIWTEQVVNLHIRFPNLQNWKQPQMTNTVTI